MYVTIESGSDALAMVAAEWDALHAVSRTATPFNSHTYVKVWWAHFGGGDDLELWTVRDGEALVGVAPFYRTVDETGASVMRFVGGLDISDYLDVVSAPTREVEVATALVDAMMRADCYCWDLHDMPQASPIREAFLRLAPAYGLDVLSECEAVCPVITLPDSWDRYLEQLDGKQRREIRRKLRRAGQEALVSWHVTPPDGVADALPIFFRLHKLSMPDKAIFMTDAMEGFFSELAHAFARVGWLELLFLHVNGHPVAAYFAFRFRDSIMLYNSGFDNEAAGTLSVGWLLLAYHIEMAIQQGVRRYDFMRGDEAYKFHFGGNAEPVYRLQLYKMQTAAA
jgi:CelD/BcsL family acetyltransferase involved in cellulose biosynthesis